MPKKIVNHTDLEVYQRALDCAMRVFQYSKEFPSDERYSMTDQIRRSSRELDSTYGSVLRTLLGMINHPDTWVITDRKKHKP